MLSTTWHPNFCFPAVVLRWRCGWQFFHFGWIIHKIGWIITKSASETTFGCWNSWTVVELSVHHPWICNVAILNCKWNLMISLTFIFVQVVPSIAIAFVTYEQVKDILGVEMRISDWSCWKLWCLFNRCSIFAGRGEERETRWTGTGSLLVSEREGLKISLSLCVTHFLPLCLAMYFPSWTCI